MSDRMIQYRVRADQVAANTGYVQDVMAELATTGAAGSRYAVFLLDDGVTFLHVVHHDDDGEGLEAFRGSPAFQRFVSTVEERCEVPPQQTELTLVGRYREGAA